jgi:hypothetical protein
MAKKKAAVAIAESPLAEKSLEQIAHCLGFLALQSEALKDKKQNDLIRILASFGFGKNAIAALLQTTLLTVSVRLSEQKAMTKSSGAKKNAKRQSKGV